jgi:hypothetical protein
MQGLATEFWGSQPLKETSLLQKITRPAKQFAVKFGLMPKTMQGKRILKRIIFGKPVKMPAEIVPNMASREALNPLPPDRVCSTHKIIYCVATK